MTVASPSPPQPRTAPLSALRCVGVPPDRTTGAGCCRPRPVCAVTGLSRLRRVAHRRALGHGRQLAVFVRTPGASTTSLPPVRSGADWWWLLVVRYVAANSSQEPSRAGYLILFCSTTAGILYESRKHFGIGNQQFWYCFRRSRRLIRKDKHPCCKRQIARFSRPHTARRTTRTNARISASHTAGYSAEFQPRSTFLMQPPRPPAEPTAATYRSPTNAAVLAGGVRE